MTILHLSKDELIEIARRVPLPQSMEAIDKKFRELKLSEYQPVSYYGNMMSLQRVFNKKRSDIRIGGPGYPDMTTNVLNELNSNRSLTSINLSHNNLVCEDAEHIAKGIAVSASLTHINLSYNDLCDKGAKYIAEGISVSASLTSIDLRDTLLGDKGAKHIAEGIAVSASLTKVLAFLPSHNICCSTLMACA